MGKLSDEEQAQLDALSAKRDAPDEIVEVTVERDGKRYHLKGVQAQRALDELFDAKSGGGSGPAPAKKAAKKAVKKAAPAPAGDGQGDGDESDDDGDQDGDEDGDGDEEEDGQPVPKHWYFGR